VRCRAEREGDEWVITGQKVWTSLAGISDWCFLLCRTDPKAPKHEGLSYLLVPMHQPGIEIVPIRQITGTAEFAEVFFEGARTAVENVVGGVNGGWKVAMATLAFERGASTLAQQMAFQGELARVIDAARANGARPRPDPPPAHRRRLDRPPHHAPQRAAHADRARRAATSSAARR
jgi:alkylation response protein AidB-like acyl-CoA dehydrogenase